MNRKTKIKLIRWERTYHVIIWYWLWTQTYTHSITSLQVMKPFASDTLTTKEKRKEVWRASPKTRHVRLSTVPGT